MFNILLTEKERSARKVRLFAPPSLKIRNLTRPLGCHSADYGGEMTGAVKWNNHFPVTEKLRLNIVCCFLLKNYLYRPTCWPTYALLVFVDLADCNPGALNLLFVRCGASKSAFNWRNLSFTLLFFHITLFWRFSVIC